MPPSTTPTDHPLAIPLTGTGTLSHRAADVVSYTDYYPFGMMMGERSGGGYRYGFNTQEKDDEIYGPGNSTTAEFWQYDARLGRRWNVDPIMVYGISNYAVFFNNPMVYLDEKGDRAWHPELNEVTGEIKYIADEGDNYQTLVEQYGEEQANEIMAENFKSVTQENIEGIEDHIQIVEGDALISSKPLKMDINSVNSMTGDKKQKYGQYLGEHLVFAMKYNNYLNDFRREELKPIDLMDYFYGINSSRDDIRTAVFGKTTQYRVRTKIRINRSYVDFYCEIPLVREYQQVESEPYKSREGPPFNGEPTIRYYFGVWGTNFNGVYMWIDYRKSKELEDYAGF